MKFDGIHIALLATIANDVRVARKNRRKQKELQERYENALLYVDACEIHIQRLSTILAKSDVELDEFDHIMLHFRTTEEI